MTSNPLEGRPVVTASGEDCFPNSEGRLKHSGSGHVPMLSVRFLLVPLSLEVHFLKQLDFMLVS